MIRCVILLVLAQVGGDPAWKFTVGASWKVEVEYLKYYRVKGGAPEMEGKDAYKDHLKATACFEVAEVAADGTAVLKVRFAPFRAGLGGDSNPDASVFDSAERKNNKDPMEWAALVPELSFKITVDPSGAIGKTQGFDVDPHLDAVRTALLGDRLLGAPAPPAPGKESSGTIRVFHDAESAQERFDLKHGTTLHDVPVLLKAQAGKAGLEVEGMVPAAVKIDLGKKGTEFFIPGVGFAGEWKGTWKEGGWVETSWSVKGSARMTIEKKEFEFEIHERYAARRLP